MAVIDVKGLQDLIFLFIGFFLLVQGTRVFLDRKRRNEAVEVVQAILMLLLGLFIVSMWYSSIRHGNNNGPGYGPENVAGSGYGYEGNE